MFYAQKSSKNLICKKHNNKGIIFNKKKEIKYLQSFSHTLLRLPQKFKDFVGQKSKQEAESSPLIGALKGSREICMQIFDGYAFSKDKSYEEILEEVSFGFSIQQVKKLEKLLKWRDFQARLEDESREFILPNQIIKQALRKESVINEKELKFYFC